MTIADCDKIGSEWRESAETDAGAKHVGRRRARRRIGQSAKLLGAARLLLGGEPLRQELGDQAHEAALADCLWGVYQMIGKLCRTVCVLRRD